MNHLKLVVAAFAVVAASVVAGAGPAAASAAPPNGTNCHGVWLSYLATSDMAPGQLLQDYGTSVKETQHIADVMCQ